MANPRASTDELLAQAETAFAKAASLAAELQITLDEVHNHIQARHHYLDNLEAASQPAQQHSREGRQ